MKPIIDVCCGSRMFWFDKQDPAVVFMDNTKASCLLGWPMESLVVWNKKYLGTNMRGFRPAYEMVALFTQPGFKIPNRCLGDVVECPRLTRKPNHPR